MPITKNFRINGTLIDLGTDGRFGPGSEDRLKAKLDEKKDGKKIFNRLVDRGAITIPEVKEQPKESEASSGSGEPKSKGKKTKKPEDYEDPKDPKDDRIYEATGKYEVHHIGGTLFHKADPDGKFIGEINTKEEAHKWADDQNKTLE